MARIVMLLFPTGPLDSVPPLHVSVSLCVCGPACVNVYMCVHVCVRVNVCACECLYLSDYALDAGKGQALVVGLDDPLQQVVT